MACRLTVPTGPEKRIHKQALKLTGKPETSTDDMKNFINAALGKGKWNSKCVAVLCEPVRQTGARPPVRT